MTKRTRQLIVFTPLALIFLAINILGAWVVFVPVLVIMGLMYLAVTIAYWVSTGKWDWTLVWRALSE